MKFKDTARKRVVNVLENSVSTNRLGAAITVRMAWWIWIQPVGWMVVHIVQVWARETPCIMCSSICPTC